jgi:HEPN domain-containing protein
MVCHWLGMLGYVQNSEKDEKMNERIQELAEQATGAEEYDGFRYFDKAKFAELIVQECLMKAIGAKIRGESIDTLIQNIKEDFGVDE